ncbi:MAG TPA: DUF1295 domain-containing protein, partial [Bacteroidales bacterium]|nr:DUF1295 domain-containing protein [Bacteroidales bacterium]
MRNVSRDRILLLFIYLVAFGTGFFIGNSYTEMPLLGKTFLMILPATIVIWLFSFLLNNSSVFDPYWSVAPAVTFGFFWWQILPVPGWAAAPLFSVARNVMVFLLLLIYGTRLTWNFLRGWKGLKQEDWRYAEIRKKTGVLYWTASLVGIHLFPALLVFAGCLSLFVVATRGNSPGFLDILGILVTGNAIWLEATADRQLRNFIRD